MLLYSKSTNVAGPDIGDAARSWDEDCLRLYARSALYLSIFIFILNTTSWRNGALELNGVCYWMWDGCTFWEGKLEEDAVELWLRDGQLNNL